MSPRGRRWDDRLTLASLGFLKINESAAVFGMLVCLVLLSLGLIANISFGISIIYAFPIAVLGVAVRTLGGGGDRRLCDLRRSSSSASSSTNGETRWRWSSRRSP